MSTASTENLVRTEEDCPCHYRRRSFASQSYSEPPVEITESPYTHTIFALLVVIMVFVNYDSGVVPAALNDIRETHEEWDNNIFLGALGCLPYAALVFASPMAGYFLNHRKNRWVVIIALLMNCASVILMIVAASNQVGWLMLTSRFFIGFTQAFFIIYAPVWIDKMSSPKRKTCWMALFQAAVPLGIAVGYYTSSVFTTRIETYWYNSLWVQVIVIFCLCVLFFVIPPSLVEVTHHDENQTEMKGEYRDLASALHLLNTLSLCVLFYCVGGIQFWGTDWLYEDFNTDHSRSPESRMEWKKTVTSTFGAVAVTGPIFGVLVGGFCLDIIGGYGPSCRQMRKATLAMIFFAIIACACGFAVAFYPRGDNHSEFVMVVALVWLLLFFGGMLVPGGMGLMLSTVPPRSRKLASSNGQALYNLLGFSSGVFVPAASRAIFYSCKYDDTECQAASRLTGMRIIIFASTLGVIFLFAAYFCIPVTEPATSSTQSAAPDTPRSTDKLNSTESAKSEAPTDIGSDLLLSSDPDSQVGEDVDSA